jgi:hypothetical protein
VIEEREVLFVLEETREERRLNEEGMVGGYIEKREAKG